MEDMEHVDGRKLSPQAQYECRRQVIRGYLRGDSMRKISRDLGMSYSSVRMTVKSYKQNGKRGIAIRQRGRPQGSCRTLSPEQEKHLQGLIRDKRPEQLKMDFALWTGAAVRLLMQRECEILLPVRSVTEYLKRWGFTAQKPIGRA